MHHFTLARKRIDAIKEPEYFAEMERIWLLLGHRPSRTEWEASQPTIAYVSYRRYFGGWVNACLRFLEFKMGAPLTEIEQSPPSATRSRLAQASQRDVPDRLRLKVLDRDGYRCVLCGRSPANEPGVVLHIDHIIPFSHQGKTELENLRVLCKECNLGRGNSELAGA